MFKLSALIAFWNIRFNNILDKYQMQWGEVVSVQPASLFALNGANQTQSVLNRNSPLN